MKTLLTIATLSMTLLGAEPAALYAKCASCHGAQAEKSALGKSKIINTMSKTEIADAIKGYQAGTYGGTLKALMKGQVAALSEEDIEALANHISAMK